MGEYRYTSLRYCPTLKRNVVFENYYGSDPGQPGDCLYRSVCGCERCCYLEDRTISILPAAKQPDNLQIRTAD